MRLDRLGCEPIAVHETNPLDALISAGTLLDAKTILLLHFGCLYAPPSLVLHACSHHLRCRNAFTLTQDWPHTAGPELYELDFLRDIRPYMILDLGSSVPTISKLAITCAAAMENSLDEPQQTVRRVSLFPRQLYDVSESDLPEAVDCVSAEGARMAAELALSRNDDADPLAPLKAWRAALIAQQSREASQYLQATARPNICRGSGGKKILFVSSAAGFSGAEEALIRVVTQIDQSRYLPYALLGSEGLFAQRLREAGAQVWCAEREFAAPNVLNTMFLLRLLSDLQPEIVHSNCRNGAPLVLAATLRGVPFIQHVRIFENAAWGDSILHARAVVCVSKKVRNLVLRLNVPKDRVRVIYDGVDTAYFAPGFMAREAARKLIDLPADRRIVSMIARFDAFKRHTYLLEAFRRVHDQMPDALLVVVGEPSAGTTASYDAFRKKMVELNLQPAVACLGFQPDIRPVMCASDVIVSTSQNEPFGLTILEGLALGRPVVTTESCGAAEVLRMLDAGTLVCDNNPAEFGEQIVRVLGSREGESDSAARIHAKLNEQGSTARRAAELMSLYDEVLERGNKTSPLLAHNDVVHGLRTCV